MKGSDYPYKIPFLKFYWKETGLLPIITYGIIPIWWAVSSEGILAWTISVTILNLGVLTGRYFEYKNL